MSSIKELTARQIVLATQLEEHLANYVKEPQDRKNNPERVESWIPRINEVWGEFRLHHEELSKYTNSETVKKYLKEIDFAKIDKKAIDTMKNINNRLLSLGRQAIDIEKMMGEMGNKAPDRSNIASTTQTNDSSKQQAPGMAPQGPQIAPQGPQVGATNNISNNDSIITLGDNYETNPNTTNRDLIERFVMKEKLFERRLTNMEKIIEMEQLEVAHQNVPTMREIWSELTEELHTVCMITNSIGEYMDIFDNIEQRYLRIMTRLDRKAVESRDLVEPVPLKLKPIQIQQFNGNWKAWPVFSGLFKTLIIDNRQLNDMQRMQYLKTNLTGAALQAIQRPGSAGNEHFQVAWKILQNRYENKRAILNMSLDGLLEHPHMTEDSAEQLQKLVDNIREYLVLIEGMTLEQCILHIVSKKIHETTLIQYETTISNPKEPQDLNEFLEFLEQRAQVLQTVKRETQKYVKRSEKRSKEGCICCGEKHALFMCFTFKKMTISDRQNFVRTKELCMLCFKPGHLSQSCLTNLKCRECERRHNTLLHFKKETNEAKASTSSAHSNNNSKFKEKSSKKSFVCVADETEDETVSCVAANQHKGSKVLLATAQIRVKTTNGWSEELCALIDQGSMATFITENIVKQLNLKRIKNDVSVSGIGGVKTEKSLGSVDIEFTARYPTSFTGKTRAIILGKLTALSPITQARSKISQCNEFNELVLADPNLNRVFKIDAILGADVFASILMHGVIKAESLELVAQETQLGWILSGVIEGKSQIGVSTISLVTTTEELNESMKRFWENEEIGSENTLSEEERYCVTHYEENTVRNEDGRYVVTIPFRENIIDLGNSRRGALAQLLHQERRFAREPELHEQYIKFMREYIEMGHMVECEDGEIINGYYLPHHAVFKDSTTTKLRVVFDASRKTSTGLSLNDCMMVGPKVQDDLFDIMLRFRLRKIAFTADIAKMYRQILIKDEQQNYQRILWRESRSENIKEYRLKTVTYGTCTAPYMAVQTIVTQAKLWQLRCPDASKIIQKDFYMDDLMSSADKNEEAIKLQQEITHILAEAGLQLRKWSSNSMKLLNAIPAEHKEGAQTDGEASISTLGLRWFNISDEFGFKMNPFKDVKMLTKRAILSEITKMYDPLGLIAPFTILCKILMQKLWIADLEWDNPVPEEIATEWENLKEQIPILLNFRLKRWIKFKSDAKIELHGFADASEQAYGAQIYAKIIENDEIHSNIIAAKTRVTPLSKQSIPRLELCAALLLAELMEKVATALQVPINGKYYYSDSKIALAWIRGSPRRWETYVGNRVAKIQKLSDKEKWHYVGTKENPADIASRGMTPKDLVQSDLWWNGPEWLRTKNGAPEAEEEIFDTTLGQRKVLVAMNLVQDEEIISRFSSLNRAIRSIAYCHRFAKITAKKLDAEEKVENNILEVSECEKAKMSLIKLCQSINFGDDIEHLKRHKEVGKTSKLKSLYPFIDSDGIMRVGGRLQNSEFEFNKRHPILLPYKSPLTRLVIDAAHKKMLHGGNQLTMMQIRYEFWIIGCKRAVKTHINQCVKCHRFRATSATQLMGSLPADRSRALVKPFTYAGTDFCGPFMMRMSNNKRIKTIKGYVAIFICFSTRAVHLEAVSDLTAEAFVASFRRFISRRGNVLKLYSDNGGNFVKAKSILELETTQAITEFNEEIKRELANLSTKFYFNPPAAPWFGGLWERNIGSVKHHFKRIIGERILSYEEMTTTIAQIEACLNSRPLCALNENPDDINVLTPGHFLIGSAITAPVAPSLLDIKENRLNRWQLCERLKQEFWKKWSDDYISSLQKRTKWQEREQNLKIGDLVLIKDEINPPLRWPLAKITQIFPGKDKLVRVVEVSTGTKRYKRAIGRLSKLPIEDNKSTENNENSKTEQSCDTIKSFFIQCHTINKQTKNTKKRTYKSKYLIYLSIGLLFFGYTPLSCETKQHTVKSINTETGIFFEKGGNLQIAPSSWHILLVMNTQTYKINLDSLQENIYELEHLCNLKKTKRAGAACEAIAIELNRQMDKIKKYDSLINIEKRRRRHPGAILAFGGGSFLGWATSKIGDYLMGNNDEKTEQLEKMLKEQTSILAIAEDIMRKNQEKFEIQMKLLINQTAEIYDQVDVLTRNAETAERSQWVATHLIITMNEFNELQKQMLELVTNAGAQLKLTWIEIEQLRSQIELIEGNLASNVKLLGDSMSEKIINIYRLAKTKSGFVDDNLILNIEIPLITNEKWEWYTMHKIPIIRDNSFLWVKSTEKTFVTDENKTKYALINREQLEKINDNSTLFRGKMTLFKFNSNHVHCEAKIFRQNEIDAEMCTLQITKQNEYWKELDNGNEWLFSLPHNVTAEVQCNKIEKTTMQLNNTGVLILAKNCRLTTEEIIIITAGEVSSLETLRELEEISSIKNDTVKIAINDKNIKKLIQMNEYKNTSELAIAIKNLQQQQNNFTSNKYQLGNYIIIYILIFLLFNMLFCVLRKH